VRSPLVRDTRLDPAASDSGEPALAADDSAAAAASRDARTLQTALNKKFRAEPTSPFERPASQPEAPLVQPPPERPVAVPEPATPKTASAAKGFWQTWRRAIKVAVGLALVVFFGWSPLKMLLVASSVEAVVNARVVVLRAPIEGVLAAAPAPWSSWTGDAALPTLKIVNAAADRSRLDDFNADRRRLLDQRAGLQSDLERAREDVKVFEDRLNAFRLGRIRLLESKLEAAQKQLDAANERVSLAAEQEAAFAQLSRTGSTSRAEFLRARLAKIEADDAAAAAANQLGETKIELDALKSDGFLGDDYNDVPVSAQRLDDLRLRVRDLEARLAGVDRDLATAQTRIDEETERLNARAEAELALPKLGRVWEALAAQGEYVTRGQPLIRLLDCSTPEVTATVAETVYDRLRVGGPAQFFPATGGPALQGVVENLTGAADASGNFAIEPGALRKETRHVTVIVPNMPADVACEVGRSGVLTFDEPDAGRAQSTAEAVLSSLGIRR